MKNNILLVAIVFSFFTSCIALSESELLIIGHRGLAGRAPENTVLSIDLAIKQGVDIIEIDVHICKTGELVVIHDETVNRTTNGTGFVASMSLKELKALDAGNGQQIPTLREVIECINKRVPLNIELKGPNTAEPVAKLINSLINNFIDTKTFKPEDFFVSSFNHFEIQKFHKLSPEIKIGAIFYGLPTSLAQIGEDVEAQIICVHKNFATEDLVADAHKRNMKIFVFTISEKTELLALKNANVDGVYCDI